jgi:hypothetical protein
MQKVRLFADCFKTKCNCRVWINPNFELDFLPKVVTFLFKSTSAGGQDRQELFVHVEVRSW